MSEWISVDERLPDEEVDVFVYYGNTVDFGWYFPSSKLFDAASEDFPEVTMWMPITLPEPPK